MKTSDRLWSVEDIGVEWIRSLALSTPSPQLRTETADPQVKLPPEVLAYARVLSQQESAYRYADFRGLLGLRQAVANHLSRMHGLDYDPESEIIITSGSTEANFLAVFAVADPGDFIMLLDPSYANFRAYAKAVGAKSIYVKTDPTNRWQIDLDDLNEKYHENQPAAILIAVPNNPTAVILDNASIAAIKAICRSKDCWLIYDTVFDQAIFKPENLPVFSELKDRLFLTGGTSKVYGLTGCRVGWLAGPPDVVTKIAKSLKLATTICANTFGQEISAFVLAKGKEWIDSLVNQWSQKAHSIATALYDLPASFYSPDGGYFIFLDCRRIEGNSYKLAKHLIHRYGLFTSPGADYGPSGEGHLRIVYGHLSDSEIQLLGQTLSEAFARYP